MSAIEQVRPARYPAVQNYIGGTFSDPAGDHLDVTNPADGSLVAMDSRRRLFGGLLRRMLVFGGVDAWMYAIDAYTGALIWRRQIDDQRFAMITGTPTYADGKLIVGLSSYEAMVAAFTTTGREATWRMDELQPQPFTPASLQRD